MTTVDYLIVALIAVSAIVGLLRGFLREVIALVTWIAALLIAWHLGRLIEPSLGGLLAPAAVRPWAARVILLFAVLLVGAGIGGIVVSLMRLALVPAVDRLLGFSVGLVRGLVILGVLVLACQTVRLDGERWWRDSLLIPYGQDAASAVRLLVGE